MQTADSMNDLIREVASNLGLTMLLDGHAPGLPHPTGSSPAGSHRYFSFSPGWARLPRGWADFVRFSSPSSRCRLLRVSEVPFLAALGAAGAPSWRGGVAPTRCSGDIDEGSVAARRATDHEDLRQLSSVEGGSTSTRAGRARALLRICWDRGQSHRHSRWLCPAATSRGGMKRRVSIRLKRGVRVWLLVRCGQVMVQARTADM